MSRFPAYSPSSPQLASDSVSQNSAEVAVAQAGTTSFTESTNESSDNLSITSWTAPKFFSDLSVFNITHFASGKDNLDVVIGITPGLGDIVYADSEGSSLRTLWRNASAMLQLFYPKNSINPAGWPRGGSEFYATPLDLSNASSVTLKYKVFFPSDFDWVKGGKLPGLYGGHTRCSGGDPALDCFSTRLMWRADGAGELYLYAPKYRQTQSLCRALPLSVCDGTYGLSIARGSFQFSKGEWTDVSQTVVLNSPGVPDGGFYLKVNGKEAITRRDVFYRDKARDPFIPNLSNGPNSQPDEDGGLLGSLLGGLVGSGLRLKLDESQTRTLRDSLDRSTAFVSESPTHCGTANVNKQTDSQLWQEPLEHDDETLTDARPREVSTQEADKPIGFKGLFFSTFFGGHHKEFATPKDQFVWFKDFALHINDQS